MRVSIQESKSNLAEDAGAPQSNHAGVMRLLATGAAVWRGGKPKGALLVLPGSGKPVSAIVLEDRGISKMEGE